MGDAAAGEDGPGVELELAVLSPLEGITKEDQESGSDYISVMLDNLEALKQSIN